MLTLNTTIGGSDSTPTTALAGRFRTLRVTLAATRSVYDVVEARALLLDAYTSHGDVVTAFTR